MNKNRNYTILVVDDVEDNLTIVTEILQTEGYVTVVARDGLSALRLVKESSIDLILLDIMMPIMSGIETCRFLKVEPQSASIPVIFLTANADRETIQRAYSVGGSDYIKKPFFKEELLARVQTWLSMREYELSLEKKVAQRTKEMEETQIRIMQTLGGIAEGHSSETYHHVDRVSEFTYNLALLSGMPEEEAKLLKNASALHDIGKLAIPDNILHKHGALSTREYKIMKTHAALGAEMLRKSELPLFKVAAIVAKQHHEKWDGTGYPNGIKGDKIHLYGRIVAIADVFDALLFKRSYKERWSVEEVVVYIKDMRGEHFDPQLVDLFFENLDMFLGIYHLHVEKQNLEEHLNSKKKRTILDWLLKKRL